MCVCGKLWNSFLTRICISHVLWPLGSHYKFISLRFLKTVVPQTHPHPLSLLPAFFSQSFVSHHPSQSQSKQKPHSYFTDHCKTCTTRTNHVECISSSSNNAVLTSQEGLWSHLFLYEKPSRKAKQIKINIRTIIAKMSLCRVWEREKDARCFVSILFCILAYKPLYVLVSSNITMCMLHTFGNISKYFQTTPGGRINIDFVFSFRLNWKQKFTFCQFFPSSLDMASPLTAVAVVQGASRGLGLQVRRFLTCIL